MFRFTRAVTVNLGADYPQALQFAIQVTKHVNEKYGIGLKTGMELFGKANLYWYYDTDSLDKITELNGKLLQDQQYWKLIQDARGFPLPGSLKDTIVNLIDA